MANVKFKCTEITVTGRGRFPLDMLRYDRCVPFNNDAVMEIEKPSIVRSTDERPEVKLLRFSPDGGKATADRWASFGWFVIQDTGKEPK